MKGGPFITRVCLSPLGGKQKQEGQRAGSRAQCGLGCGSLLAPDADAHPAGCGGSDQVGLPNWEPLGMELFLRLSFRTWGEPRKCGSSEMQDSQQ